jgi:NADP-dependent 3-hydroxy acid dehydrogenase YdfG
MPKKSIDQTVVFITGASNGIGLATAERFAKEGYNVIATSRSPEDRPNLLALAKKYPNLAIKKLDVTDTEHNINALFKSIKKIDILINNAGIGIVGVAESFSPEQIQSVINTNVFGVVNVTNAVLPDMRARNCGKIITISSIVGPLPDMRQCFYSGSKAMVEHYTSQLKNDLQSAGYNITVANIHPGPVVTNFETSAPIGERFIGKVNPYPQMHADVAKWRTLMQNGRPVEETVNTILKVIRSKKPFFWNPTESRVQDNFARIYCDSTGESFSKGPSFAAKLRNLPKPKAPQETTVKNKTTSVKAPILVLHAIHKGKNQSLSAQGNQDKTKSLKTRTTRHANK